MAADTKIEWCDHTFNPWIGCTKVSTAATCGGGCDGCYAEVSTPVRVLRAKGIETWGPHAARHRTSPSNWAKPRQWNAQHEAFFAEHGRRQRVFCASLADVFDNAAPIAVFTEFLDLCRLTPNLDKLLLTKRIGNVERRLAEALEYSHEAMLNPVLANWIVTWLDGDAPTDMWLGATVVNQHEADRDIPKLQDTPAAVRFLSMEPLLGPVSLGNDGCGKFGGISRASGDDEWTYCDHPLEGKRSTKCGEYQVPRIDWVIVGGESGPGARPMHPDWPRSLRNQCQAAGVPFLFKQHGEWVSAGEPAFGTVEGKKVALIRPNGTVVDPLSDEGRDENADIATMSMVGKSAAGRLLDGRTWDQFPEARHGAA